MHLLLTGTMGKTDIPGDENLHLGTLYKLNGPKDVSPLVDKVIISSSRKFF